MTPELVVLGIGLGIAAVIDARTGRIPNWLVLFMLVGGIGLHTLQGNYALPWLGATLAFAIHFPLWMLRVEKAGDAKLIMGVGACVGWGEMIETTLWCAVFYLPVGMAVLVITGRLGNLRRMFDAMVRRRLDAMSDEKRARMVERLAVFRISVPEKPDEAPKPTMLRTAPIIAAAGLLATVTDWLHFIG